LLILRDWQDISHPDHWRAPKRLKEPEKRVSNSHWTEWTV
jgi:hypothetical protein